MNAFKMHQSWEEDREDVAYNSAANVQDYFEWHIQLFDRVAYKHYKSDVKSFTKADVLRRIMLDIE